jgi:hypothetical protein
MEAGGFLAGSLKWCVNRNPDQTDGAMFALFGVFVPTLANTNHLAPNTRTLSRARPILWRNTTTVLPQWHSGHTL